MDLWSDDPADAAYNLMVRAPHGFSATKGCAGPIRCMTWSS
jgi:L,D-peptidoglycan transpeptidase YkuD (ErfK/YbiS/YcfS/YnhG family)